MHLFQKATRRGKQPTRGGEQRKAMSRDTGSRDPIQKGGRGAPQDDHEGEAGGQLCIDMGAASPDGQVRRFQEEFLPEGETDKSI